jgi:hypothetical protein
LLNLSVEEENLSAIPFAVLERRIGRRTGKIEVRGTKVLPDGAEMRVTWQVQGNDELGLPTEQDLDIFVALGALTFRNNLSKTVTFTGREIARILGISGVHGKFYRRIKLAMDRFIPLRFRALAETDRQEEVKWLNVFQEASFSLDRTTGRATGSVTWTDKLIESMDRGFFRVLDAGRYMELDGITAKHLYRFLAVAFEKTDLIVIDARRLCLENLAILKLPTYFSRLMQTLEPAFEQLIRIQVLGEYYVVAADEWTLALRRHPSYVPERKTLLLEGGVASPELTRAWCLKLLETSGFAPRVARLYADAARTKPEFYAIERACRTLKAMREADVLPHVAMSFARRALDAGPSHGEGRELLDWCEIALELTNQKKRAGQVLKNAPGLIITIIKDPEARARLVDAGYAAALKEQFRQREGTILRQEQQAEEKTLIVEYEQYRRRVAEQALAEMPEARREALRKQQVEALRAEGRYERIPPEIREQEVDGLMLRELARREAPPFERWRLRKSVQQAMLPFTDSQAAAG